MNEAPTIVQLAERVLVQIEDAVRTFPRYHKYASGAELRDRAREVARAALRAWRDQRHRGDALQRLVIAVDDLKLDLQVAKELKAFRSFGQFEAIARNISELGRQCGGWQRQHHKSQNSRTMNSAGRAQILSARDTSHEVNV